MYIDTTSAGQTLPNAASRLPWWNRQRVIGYATILAIVELGFFLFCVAGAHGLIVPLDKPASTDFVSFHAAGQLAWAGTPWLAYDRAAHHAAEQAAAGAGIAYNYFYYPPVYLLICAPLSRLPYLMAFVVFQVLGGVACLFAIRLIRRDLPAVILLAFPGFWWAIGTGQNALLTASLFAAGTALSDRRPWVSGICFGALCYKPHFGLLIPVALLAAGNWRAFVSGAAAVAALIAASCLCFGVETWRAFLTASMGSGDVYGGHGIFMDGLTSPYGMLMVWGWNRDLAIAAQVVVALLLMGLVTKVWFRARLALPVRAAVLLAATPVAVPLMMFYDLMIVFVALLWLSLIPSGRACRPLWWTLGMAAAFLGPMFAGNLSSSGHWMFAALTALIALGVASAVAWPAVNVPVTDAAAH